MSVHTQTSHSLHLILLLVPASNNKGHSDNNPDCHTLNSLNGCTKVLLDFVSGYGVIIKGSDEGTRMLGHRSDSLGAAEVEETSSS